MKSIIQTPANDLEKSIKFYQKLNFEVISHENPAWVSDGKVVVEINPDRFARAGIKLLNASWKTTVEKLEKTVAVNKIDDGFLLSDPSGVWIYLIETGQEIDADLTQVSPSVLGKFAGVSLESTAIENSIKIWEVLGFSKSMGVLEQGWISLKNQDDLTITLMKPLMCPHLFFNPSLTYFNGKDNLSVIEKIRATGIPISEEITHFNDQGIVDNIIIRDPGGYGFFIFND